MSPLYRFLLFIAITFNWVNYASAQQFTLSIKNANKLVADKNNQLQITAGKTKCSDLIVTADNGNISRDSCVFSFVPTRKGRTVLSVAVKTKTGTQKIGDTVLYVEEPTCNPACYVMGAAHGQIPLNKLMSARRLSVGFPDCNWKEVTYFVSRYTLFVVRKSELLYTQQFSGNNPEFDPATLDMLGKLEQGDEVWFRSVQVIDAGPARYVSELKLIITREKEEKEEEMQGDVVTKIISRKISLSDSALTPKQKTAQRDSALTEILVNKVLAGKLKAYPARNYHSPTPLSKTEVGKIVAAEADTMEVEDLDGTVLKKIIKRELDYSQLNSFKVLEKWKHNLKTGKTDVTVLCIAPVKNYYNDDGTFFAFEPLFWVDYPEAKTILDNYDAKHPDVTFEHALWDIYLREQ